MLSLVLVIVVGLVILAFSEFVRKRLKISNEDSRKTYHVVHALVIAVAPFLVSYGTIIALEIALLLTMLVVRQFKLLPWLYKVGRISWGDYFGVIGVIVIALMNPNKWVFLAAILHLGIADAAAALIGKRYGKKQQFKVFGQVKSLVGSAAFFLSSFILTYIVIHVSQSGGDAVLLMATLPLLATCAEAVSPFGTDNLVIPVLVVSVLGTLQFGT